jgi:hypothetical protein
MGHRDMSCHRDSDETGSVAAHRRTRFLLAQQPLRVMAIDVFVHRGVDSTHECVAEVLKSLH